MDRSFKIMHLYHRPADPKTGEGWTDHQKTCDRSFSRSLPQEHIGPPQGASHGLWWVVSVQVIIFPLFVLHITVLIIFNFVFVQERERVLLMLVCQRNWHGCGAWESCDVFSVATGSPRKLTGTCKCEFCWWLSVVSFIATGERGLLLSKCSEVFSVPPGTTVSIWGPRVMFSKTNASWWSTSTNWRQIRLARSFWRKSFVHRCLFFSFVSIIF